MKPLKNILFALLIFTFAVLIASQYTTCACDGGGGEVRILFKGNLTFEKVYLGTREFNGTLEIVNPWFEPKIAIGINKIVIKEVIVPFSKIPINNKIKIQSANIEPTGAIKYQGKTLIIEKAKIKDCADVEKIVRYRSFAKAFIFKTIFSPYRR